MPDGLPDVPSEMMESIGDAVEGVETPVVAAAEPTNQATEETTATPEGTATEEAATETPDSFTKLDPNTLPPEVQPYYKSLLADYTRKQQEASPYRKLGEEFGVDADGLRQAAELYAFFQDENNVKEFVSRAAQQYGLGQGPQAPATEATQGDEFANLDDPAVASLRAELDSIKQTIAERDANAQREALQWALLGEMNRQQAIVQEQHPDWGNPDAAPEEMSDEWKAVWNLAPAFNGDVLKASQMVEAVGNAASVRLLNGKAAAAHTEGLTPAAPSRAATTPVELATDDLELRAQTAAAIEMVRGIVNQSE